MRWYVLQVSSGQEKAVRDALHEKRIPALVPSENRLVRKGGEWTQKEYILFPGYVFLRLDYTSETYYRVRSIPHTAGTSKGCKAAGRLPADRKRGAEKLPGPRRFL